jgi:hypothetical protein
MFKLEIGDIFVYVDEGKGFTSRISRWAIGRYNHVSMYIGKGFGEVPFVFESNGRGASIVSLQHQTGRLVTVMRPIIKRGTVIDNAITLASDPKSYYDYFAYVHDCLPRVLWEKFPFLPIKPEYIRDATLICSEAIAECYWRAGIEILPQLVEGDAKVIPLPGDFVKTLVLDPVYEGRLLQDIQP